MNENHRKYLVCGIVMLLIITLFGGIIVAIRKTENDVKLENSSDSNVPTSSLASTPTQSPIPSEVTVPTEPVKPTKEPTPTEVTVPTEPMEPTKEPTPTQVQVPTTEPTKVPATNSATTSDDVKKVIAIDAGHQKKGNSEKEPNGPGSSIMKAKVSQGTTGVATKVPEYMLTLDVSQKLKEELTNRGYEVIMIRESHDVNLSNAERAAIANESADIFIRIHANGSEDSTVNGALTIYPSKENEFVGYMSEECKKLSKEIIDQFVKATGAKNRGAVLMDNMSGINWCTIPVTIVEMGFMSNKDEDKLMQTSEYQEKMVTGIANGVDSYFEN